MEVKPEGVQPKLYDALLRSETECTKRYRAIQEQIQRYHGPAHVGRNWTVQYDPNNAAWSFVASTVAAMTAVSTRIFFNTRRPVSEERVEALEDFVARWQSNVEWERERERGLVDMCFGGAVWVVEQRPMPGFEDPTDPVYMPVGKRISPSLYGFDIDADSQEEARFKWHKVIADSDEFLENAENEFGWDLAVCKQLVAETYDEVRAKPNPSGSSREVIAYYSVWCPKTKLPEDDAGWGDMGLEERTRCHGVVYTYGRGRSGGLELRAPVPYFGPRQGRYVTEGFMIVPDEGFWLAPLTAMDGRIKQLNAQAKANDLSAERKKTIAIFNAPTVDGKAAILDAVDGDVISIPGFQKDSLGEITTGGIDPESRAREIELGIGVDRGLFTSDARRGEVTGIGTASENMIAAQAGDKIDGLWKKRLGDVDRKIGLIVAWYGDQDERTVLALGDGELFLGGMTPKQQLGSLRVALANGLVSPEEAESAREQLEQRMETDEERGGGFDDLEIEVEILGDAGIELARMQLIDQVVLNLPALVQLAPVAAKGLAAYMKAKSDLLHAPYLEDFVDWDAAAAMVTEQQEAANAPAAKPVTPRLQSLGKPPASPGGRSGGGMNARKEASTARAAGATSKKAQA